MTMLLLLPPQHAAASSSSSPSTSYDVFINHRGPDVKSTFASHLYFRLESIGLQAFLDKPELEEGRTFPSQIKAAIQSAAIHIAIFSPDYAASSWCLDKLIYMIESGATILPVFYNVEPSELRWTGKAGRYFEALRKHEEKKRFNSETIERWRKTLATAADISGFELKAFNGDEGQLLEEVLQRVLNNVDKKPLKFVAEHATGLKQKLEDFETKVLQRQQGNAVGIVGQGGVGKTTLAKEYFSKRRSNYHRSCFLYDVRENAGNRSQHSLQRKLLKDLTGLDRPTNSIDEGEDADTVIAICGSVGPLTDLVNKCLLEVDYENKIKMHDQIRDMGRSIAEKESSSRLGHQTTKNIDDLLERSSCGTIEVRGITMDGPSNFDEENTRLLMSEMSWYRRWSSQLFGHYLRRLLDNFHFCGILNLQLVSAESDYLERILGRARAPDIQWIRWYKCTHSFLPSWIPMENLEVLEVEGRKLRVLWERESQVPRQLRALSICAPLSRFPKSIMQLKHFEKIDIRNALFKTLPEELCDVHSLKYLELRDCSEMISLPDSLGNLTNLQLIDLTNASSLQMLPSSFGNLIGLKDLFLRGCPNLTISNEAFGNINTLEHLDLKGCRNVKELPPQVAHQRFLVKLDVSTTMLEGFTANGIDCLLRCWKCLKELSVSNCPVLKCFPNSFGLLTQLIWLRIENFPQLKCLPDSFGLLTQLRELNIENCGIEYLPKNLQINNLRSLDVRGCPLRELPFRRVEGKIERELNTLDKCMFHGGVCPNLQGVFPNLRSLILSNCKELRQIGRLCGLPKLEYLYLNECENIEELSCVDTLISLKLLDVRGCAKLEKIEGLGKFIELPGVEPSRLFNIYLANCPKLQLSNCNYRRDRKLIVDLAQQLALQLTESRESS